MRTQLLFVFLFIFVIFSNSQTADQIIKKHLEITGGINNWKDFNSVILKGEMVLGLKEAYPIEIYQKRPNWNKTIMITNGKKMLLNGYNGKKAVKYNFHSHKLENDFSYVPEAFDSDLLDYLNKGFQAVLIGTEKINGTNCYKVKLIKNTNVTTYCFDVKSYQLIREINTEETKTYSNFRKSSTLTFPYKIEIKSIDNQSDFVLIFKTIEVNKLISSKEFNF